MKPRVTVTATLDLETAAQLQREAAQKGIATCTLARRIVERHLAEQRQQQTNSGQSQS